MSSCCSSDLDESKNTKSKPNTKLKCPKCQQICKTVSKSTVLQHLSFPFNLEVNNEQYYYCANTSCDKSYFSESENQYNTEQLRDKLELQQGWLCYCFDISKQHYQDALNNGTASTIKDFVIKQTKLHLCACETRNPSGQCCLADFKRMEK